MYKKNAIVRVHCKSICFACDDCNSFISRTFATYCLELGDFANYFQRCFLKRKTRWY